MYKTFKGEIISSGSIKFIDISSIFPSSIRAFFVVENGGKFKKEDIGNFLLEQNLEFSKICRLKQIHSDVIVKEGDEIEADGIWTDNAGVVLTIKVADCVPLLFSFNDGQSLCAVHSSWKGTYLKIAAKCEKICDLKKCDSVWIGPSIRKCCYRVPFERVESFRKEFPLSKGVFLDECKLDLPVINAEIINSSGITEDKIHLDGRCSCCGKEGFASYRRDGEKAGRMLLIALKKK